MHLRLQPRLQPKLQPRRQPYVSQAALLGLLRLRDAAQQATIAQELLSQVAAGVARGGAAGGAAACRAVWALNAALPVRHTC